MVVAAWIPGWYELDQPLEVGFTGEFVFWKVVPDHLRCSERLVFYNTIWHAGDGVFASGKIVGIRHHELGEVRKIDTCGLDYTITLVDGTELLVNAEEEPGKLFEGRLGNWKESKKVIEDWRCEVAFESLSELSTESKG